MDVLGHKWEYIIIPDCRFQRNRIVELSELQRKGKRDFDSSLNEEQKSHSSETALNKFG